MTHDNNGWIKIWRQIQDDPLWTKGPFSPGQAWIDLILLANSKDAVIFINGRTQKINRGQHWTSVRTLGRRWNWSNEKVSNFLRYLEADDKIILNRTRSGTLVTIVKYGVFQNTPNTTPNVNGNETRRLKKTTEENPPLANAEAVIEKPQKEIEIAPYGYDPAELLRELQQRKEMEKKAYGN